MRLTVLDQNALAGMIFTLLLALLIGGFILLYPLTRRLGLLLEEKVRAQQGSGALPAEELRELHAVIQSLEAEVGRVAERQQFIEQLLARREADALPRPGGVEG